MAERLGMDPKTVERWITVGRTPYPRYRHAIAVMAGKSETYLWPKALPSQRRTEVAQSEIVQVYPHRSSLPGELWDSLLERATTYVDILVYVGMFMTEKPDLLKTATGRASRELVEGPGPRRSSDKCATAGAFAR